MAVSFSERMVLLLALPDCRSPGAGELVRPQGISSSQGRGGGLDKSDANFCVASWRKRAPPLVGGSIFIVSQGLQQSVVGEMGASGESRGWEHISAHRAGILFEAYASRRGLGRCGMSCGLRLPDGQAGTVVANSS